MEGRATLEVALNYGHRGGLLVCTETKVRRVDCSSALSNGEEGEL